MKTVAFHQLRYLIGTYARHRSCQGIVQTQANDMTGLLGAGNWQTQVTTRSLYAGGDVGGRIH
jgi:hypothetical protein